VRAEERRGKDAKERGEERGGGVEIRNLSSRGKGLGNRAGAAERREGREIEKKRGRGCFYNLCELG